MKVRAMFLVFLLESFFCFAQSVDEIELLIARRQIELNSKVKDLGLIPGFIVGGSLLAITGTGFGIVTSGSKESVATIFSSALALIGSGVSLVNLYSFLWLSQEVQYDHIKLTDLINQKILLLQKQSGATW